MDSFLTFVILAAVNGQSLLGLLVTIIVVAKVIIGLVAVIFLINILLQIAGGDGFIRWCPSMTKPSGKM